MQAPDTPAYTTSVLAPPRPFVAPPPPYPAPVKVPFLRRRPMQFLLFVIAILMHLVARSFAGSAARGLAFRFDLADVQPLLAAVAELFLVCLGFALLRAIERRRMPLRMALGIPQRKTAGHEVATGAAIGWGIAIASVLPMALMGALRVHTWTTQRAFLLLAISIATLAVATLAHTIGTYGYPLSRLIEAIGPTRAVIFLSLITGLYTAYNAGPSDSLLGTTMLVAVLASLLLTLGWIRTHAIWLSWGLHFALAAGVGIVFGLPVAGITDFATVIETRAVGRFWLTGGPFGPSASILTILFLAAAIPILIRATSDFAWDYTRPPLIPGGYDVTIPPPAAHIAMEAEQATRPINPASLVQILPAASPAQNFPTE